MFKKNVVLVVAMVIALGFIIRPAPKSQEPKPGVHQQATDSREKSASICQMTEHNGTVEVQSLNYLSGDGTVQYFDPATCGAYPIYPFEITSLSISLFDDSSGVQWPVMLDIVVYNPSLYGLHCSGPGLELCRVTTLFDSATFAFPNIGTVAFPGSGCCVYGPFYIGVEYVDAAPGPFPSIVFDDSAPDSCDLWFFNFNASGIWEEWYDVHGVAPPGYPLWTVGGNTASGICGTMDIERFYTIPEVYDNISLLELQEVRVLVEYVAPSMSIMVSSYAEYLRDEVMPVNSDMVLTGLLPDTAYWYGGQMIVTGIVFSSPDPYPAYGTDTLEITIIATGYEYLDFGWGIFPAPVEGDREGQPEGRIDRNDCDSCKFAILVSSGGAERWKRADYWENIVALRKHKIDNEGYCPENIIVHFDAGDAQDDTDIPDAQVEPATEAAIDASHDEISRRIAACNRAGKKSTVQKMFTNHGSNDNGVVLTGAGDGRYLSPEECRQMQQRLIDSCCAYLFDEFITCYGGDMLNGLKDINNQNKTQIHVNSAAPDDAPGWSPVFRINAAGDTVWMVHHYLNEKIASLAAGKSYEEAVRDAEDAYIDFLEDVLAGVRRDSTRAEGNISHWQSESDRGDALFGAGDLTLAQWIEWQRVCDSALLVHQRKLNKANQRISRLNRQVNGDGADRDGQGCPSWVRHTYKEYCKSKKFVAPPGGELRLDFEGTGGCGNVTVWEQTPTGWVRERVWNWNLPGSYLYSPGNESRVIHVPEDGSGIYWVHNDNGEYTVTAESFSGRPDAVEDSSNVLEGFGFSLGADDSTFVEFSVIYGTGHQTWGTDEIGFNLSNVPAILDPYEGVGTYSAYFTALAANQWWTDMELYLNILYVNSPGTLLVTCPTAELSPQEVYIDAPGEYLVPLGAVAAPSEGVIIFDTRGTVGFAWDSWGFRSLVPKFPVEDCVVPGDVDHSGGVDVGDVTYLVAYLFRGGPPPPLVGEADADGSGGIDVGDLTYLVDYLFRGGPPPMPC